MSALDQAFVKAYEQPIAAVVSPTDGPAPMVAAPPAVKPAAPGAEGNVAPTPVEPAADAVPAAPKPRPGRDKPSRARKSGGQRAARRALARSASTARADVPASREKSASAHARRSPDANGSKPSGEFRPLLEVDAFLWPKNVDKLVAADQAAMEQLAGNLLKRVRRGQKVVGWQACRHGDGCSTLLLAAARRLVEQGLRVALVDADFRHPALARRLGLTPNSGWEEVAAGRLSLEEIVVESLQDGVGLAPWCEPTGKGTKQSAELPAGSLDPAPLLEMLRQNYDMVLVDLGHGDADGSHAALLDALRSGLDAVLVVHKVDEVPQAELRRVCRTISRAGTARVAVVENFV